MECLIIRQIRRSNISTLISKEMLGEETWIEGISKGCEQVDETRMTCASLRGRHRIVFDRFNTLPQKLGIVTETEEFGCCNDKWSILIWPGGHNSESSSSVSVQLRYAGSSRYASSVRLRRTRSSNQRNRSLLRVRFGFQLSDGEGHILHSHSSLNIHEYHKDGSMYGWMNFCSQVSSRRLRSGSFS